MEIQHLKNGIEAGVTFLHKQQRPSGQFRLRSSVDVFQRTDNTFETLTFLTSCVADCLRWVPGADARDIRRRVIDALAVEVDGPGLCRYFAREQTLPIPTVGVSVPLSLVPDVDTTSCVAFVLEREGISTLSTAALLANRTPDGLFQTWFLAEPPAFDDMLPFLYMVPQGNDVCCGINANALLCLGECEATRPVSEYLQRTFCGPRPEEHSAYYTDETVLYYMYSRAYREGARSLGTARDTILERLLSLQQPDGSFGTALRTAMAVCVLANFEVTGRAQADAVRSLLDCQGADGSWPSAAFYTWDRRKTPMQLFLCSSGTRREIRLQGGPSAPDIKHFGSEEVTTAYCLEALSRFAGAQ
ncbi:MAG: hypothetical protein JO250_16975 [Armatimonadetes bacterium]|nr:hypothetical protein [Armatimonadota bacterium]